MVPNFKQTWIAFVVLAFIAMPGCALFQTRTPTPETEQARLVELDKVVTTADNAITIARSFQDFEIQMHEQGLVTPANHLKYQRAFKTFFAASKTAMQAAGNLATPEAARKEAALEVLHAAQDLLGEFSAESNQGLRGFIYALEAVIKIFL